MNKLSINIKKSNFIIFKSRKRKQNFDFDFSINGTNIDRVKEVVFLQVKFLPKSIFFNYFVLQFSIFFLILLRWRMEINLPF